MTGICCSRATTEFFLGEIVRRWGRPGRRMESSACPRIQGDSLELGEVPLSLAEPTAKSTSGRRVLRLAQHARERGFAGGKGRSPLPASTRRGPAVDATAPASRLGSPAVQAAGESTAPPPAGGDGSRRRSATTRPVKVEAPSRSTVEIRYCSTASTRAASASVSMYRRRRRLPGTALGPSRRLRGQRSSAGRRRYTGRLAERRADQGGAQPTVRGLSRRRRALHLRGSRRAGCGARGGAGAAAARQLAVEHQVPDVLEAAKLIVEYRR